MSELAYLTKNEKNSIKILSIASFLEYFDLMLYAHLSATLNQQFFPSIDPNTNVIVTSFIFFSTYALKPLFVLIFGYIGDKIGRRETIIVSSRIMAAACIIMCIVPTYDSIGITATLIITLCRILQNLTSMGLFIGSAIYLTELTKAPLQNVVVSFMSIASSLGAFACLGLVTIMNYYDINWRFAFLIGSLIGIVGIKARDTLLANTEFTDAKKLAEEQSKKPTQEIITSSSKEKFSAVTLWSYFFIKSSWPVCFYLKVIYLGNILTEKFGYNTADIVYHNFKASFFVLIISPIICWLTYYINPLKILQYIIIGFSVIILFLPYILENVEYPHQILMLQSCLSLFYPTAFPANAIFYNHLPILKRFTYSSFIYAASRIIMSLVKAIGFFILIDKFGYIGLYMIFIPIIIGFSFGLQHFMKLEKKRLELTNIL